MLFYGPRSLLWARMQESHPLPFFFRFFLWACIMLPPWQFEGRQAKIIYGLQDLSSSYDIKATPSVFFLKNGEQIDKLVGCNKPELLKKITAILDSQPESPCLQPQPQWEWLPHPVSSLHYSPASMIHKLIVVIPVYFVFLFRKWKRFLGILLIAR